MTVPAHVASAGRGLAGEVPGFPCNCSGDPVEWRQDTLVSPFLPEGGRALCRDQQGVRARPFPPGLR